MATESRHKKMYKETPKFSRNEETGKVVVKKEKSTPNVEATRESDGTSGMPIHVRHAAERRDMHSRHATEHGVHDYAKAGAKKEMHARHEKEMKDMHKRHESDLGATGSEEIKTITKK